MLNFLKKSFMLAVAVFVFGCSVPVNQHVTQAPTETTLVEKEILQLNDQAVSQSLESKEKALEPVILTTNTQDFETEIVNKPTAVKPDTKPIATKQYIYGLSLTQSELDQIKKDIVEREGYKSEFYLGRNGVPTIGAGQTIGERSKKTGLIKLHSHSTINKMMKKAGIKKLNNGEYACLVDMVGSANFEIKRGTYNRFITNIRRHSNDGLYKLSDVKIQGKCSDNSYVLTKSEKSKLLDYSVVSIYKQIEHWAKEYNIDLARLPIEIKEVVYDLFYRGGRHLVLGKNTPSINKALLTDDRLALAKELYARSNGDKIWQNDLRNASLLLLVKRTLTFDQSQELDKFIANDKLAHKVNLRLFKMFAKYKNPTDGETVASVKEIISLQPLIKAKLARLDA